MARQHSISVGNAKKRAQTAEYRFRIGDEFLIAQAEDTLWSTFPVLQTEPLKLSPFVGNHIRVWLLLDSRVVDVPMASNPTFVTLSSLKPFFFNGLQN